MASTNGVNRKCGLYFKCELHKVHYRMVSLKFRDRSLINGTGSYLKTKISMFLFLFIEFSKMFTIFTKVHEMVLKVNEIKTTMAALK